MNTVLLIDDDENYLLVKALLEPEFSITAVKTREEADAALQKNLYSVLLVNCLLASQSGSELIRELSAKQDLEKIPLVFLSPSKSSQEMAAAFAAGASDYVLLSALPDELRLRVRAQSRIYHLLTESKDDIQIGNMRLFIRDRMVSIESRKTKLSGKEFDILCMLCENQNQIIKAEDVVKRVWTNASVSSGNLYTQIYNLKKKLFGFNGKITTLNRVGLILKGPATGMSPID